MNAIYHTIINDVEAPLQKGMSARDDGRFKRQDDHARPTGAAGRARAITANADAAHAALRHHGASCC